MKRLCMLSDQEPDLTHHFANDLIREPNIDPSRDPFLQPVGLGLLEADSVSSDPIQLLNPSLQIRLFHELGGSQEWCDRVVVPHVKYWSAHVHRLEMTGPDQDVRGAGEDAPQKPRFVIEYLIEEGLSIVQSSQGLPQNHPHSAPASRLMKLHQAVIDTIWCVLQGIAIRSETGVEWRLGQGILKGWLEQQDTLRANLSLFGHIHQDRWNQAIRDLIRQEIWLPTPTGRWLPAEPQPLLLWPLAAKDLQHQFSEYGYEALSIEEVRRALKQWGYTNQHSLSGELFSWMRSDGKSFFGLQSTPRLIALMQGQHHYDWSLPLPNKPARKAQCVA